MPELKDLKLSPLLLSIVYHAIAVGAIVFFMLHQPPDDDGQNAQPIQIESINEAKPKLTKFQKKSQTIPQNNGERTARSHGNSHQVSLSDLGMRLDTSERPQESNNLPSQSENDTYETPDMGGWDLMNPDPRMARFNQYVYNVVQGWLDRDAYQNTQMLSGTVKIRVWFDKDGNYLEKETNYDAIDPQFQKIVERALRKAFVRPIPHPFMYTNKKFFIDRMVVLRQ